MVATIRGMRSTAAAKRERVDQFGDKVKRQILTYEWQYGENLSEPKRLGCWLVLGDSSGVAGQIADRLEYYGAMVSARVAFGQSYQQQETNYQVRPLHAEDFQQVFMACGELDGIVLAHSLDENPSDPSGEHAVACTLLAAQSMLAMGWERKPRVYVVTQSAFAAQPHDDPVQPRQSAVNGFVRVAFSELDGFQWSTVDVPSHLEANDLDGLVLELLCDDPHDEVALRGGLRLVSELTDSQVLAQDRIAYTRLDDENPILVRPLQPQSESVGTARILATQKRPLSPTELRVRVDSVVVPANLLLDPASDFIDQPMIVFLGTVLETGDEVHDLKPSARIVGYAPSELGSQLVVQRHEIRAIQVDDRLPASLLVGSLDRMVRAEHVLSQLGIEADATPSPATRNQSSRPC